MNTHINEYEIKRAKASQVSRYIIISQIFVILIAIGIKFINNWLPLNLVVKDFGVSSYVAMDVVANYYILIFLPILLIVLIGISLYKSNQKDAEINADIEDMADPKGVEKKVCFKKEKLSKVSLILFSFLIFLTIVFVIFKGMADWTPLKLDLSSTTTDFYSMADVVANFGIFIILPLFLMLSLFFFLLSETKCKKHIQMIDRGEELNNYCVKKFIKKTRRNTRLKLGLNSLILLICTIALIAAAIVDKHINNWTAVTFSFNFSGDIEKIADTITNLLLISFIPLFLLITLIMFICFKFFKKDSSKKINKIEKSITFVNSDIQAKKDTLTTSLKRKKITKKIKWLTMIFVLVLIVAIVFKTIPGWLPFNVNFVFSNDLNTKLDLIGNIYFIIVLPLLLLLLIVLMLLARSTYRTKNLIKETEKIQKALEKETSDDDQEELDEQNIFEIPSKRSKINYLKEEEEKNSDSLRETELSEEGSIVSENKTSNLGQKNHQIKDVMPIAQPINLCKHDNSELEMKISSSEEQIKILSEKLDLLIAAISSEREAPKEVIINNINVVPENTDVVPEDKTTNNIISAPVLINKSEILDGDKNMIVKIKRTTKKRIQRRKKDISLMVSEKISDLNISKKISDKKVEEIFLLIVSDLSNNNEVVIPGFGKITPVTKEQREGINPLTGETITIQSSVTSKLKSAKALKEAMNGFEPKNTPIEQKEMEIELSKFRPATDEIIEKFSKLTNSKKEELIEKEPVVEPAIEPVVLIKEIKEINNLGSDSIVKIRRTTKKRIQKNKKDIILMTSEKTSDQPIDKKILANKVDEIFKAITSELSKGNEVSIPGFGKLVNVSKAAREGINPLTGEKISIEASTTSKLKSAKVLKEAMNGFEPKNTPTEIKEMEIELSKFRPATDEIIEWLSKSSNDKNEKSIEKETPTKAQEIKEINNLGSDSIVKIRRTTKKRIQKNKKDIILMTSEKTSDQPIDKKILANKVDEIFKVITSELSDGNEVAIPGFGKLVNVSKAAREGINPLTGEKISIEASTTSKLKSAKVLKEAMNGFEPKDTPTETKEMEIELLKFRSATDEIIEHILVKEKSVDSAEQIQEEIPTVEVKVNKEENKQIVKIKRTIKKRTQKNKKDLNSIISEKLSGEFNSKELETQVSNIFKIITSELSEGNEVAIPGFGKFAVIAKSSREGINPLTGQKIVIEASNAPKLKAAKSLKEAMNGFEPKDTPTETKEIEIELSKVKSETDEIIEYIS